MISGPFVMKNKKIPNKFQPWAEAQRRFHLTDAQLQMARELGMNPGKFGKLANHEQDPSKTPLPEFIESLYLKRFGKTMPDKVMSIQERIQAGEEKKRAKKQRKQARQDLTLKPLSEEIDEK